MKNKKFAKNRKAALAALCALSVTCTGLAAACTPSEENVETPSTQREDTQLLKNGNFEYFTVPEDAVHLIKSVNSWTRSGDSTGTMSGVIDTSEVAWEMMTDKSLKDKLDANNDLSASDPDYEDLYVDYNGMDSDDLLYVDSYAAALENATDKDDIISQWFSTYKDFMGVTGDDDEGYFYNGVEVYQNPDDSSDVDFYFDKECTQSIRFAMVNNPETHYGKYREENGKHYLGDTQVYLDEKGYYFEDEDLEAPAGNVLMLHNYPTNKKYNGIEQHYTSQTITLEANTAAEISLWVKTSNLKFDKGHALNGQEENRGAYIEVTQSVGSNSVDSFKIRAINTEKIIADNGDTLGENESNGWLKYTIYVNACDFQTSTISINLGLGDSDNALKVTGYAFFDDVKVEKFIDLSDEGCTYKQYADIIADRDNPTPKPSYCSLTSEADDKIFVADKKIRNGVDERFSTRFQYLIDLASDNYTNIQSMKEAVGFVNNVNLKTSLALTTEESNSKTYASATANEANVVGFNVNDKDKTYLLPDGMKKEGGRPTFNDLIGIYGADKFAAGNGFGENDFTGTDNSLFRNLAERLNSALVGENGLNALSRFSLSESGSMVVMLSAYGAAYTATLENAEAVDDSLKLFTVDGYKNTGSTNYKIVSFWIKTSDLNGKTAATVKLVDAQDDKNSASFTVDSTDITTDVGEEKDIYSGWVQCFFFVKNDTAQAKDFKIELSFGNTAIANTTGTSYTPGWIAMANMQSIDVTEEVFDLVSDGTYSKTFTFTDEDTTDGNEFDAANGMTNIKNGVANPSKYNGVNGGSSYVTDKEFNDDYDRQNGIAGGVGANNGIAGLINRDSFKDYENALDIAKAFNSSLTDAQTAWNEVFGEDCYQPLIIVNSLRQYLDRASEIKSEEEFNQFKDKLFVKDEDGTYVSATEWDPDTTYYWYREVVNYGFIGDKQTVSSNSYVTVSVRVMVSTGATAYLYLVDPTDRNVMSYKAPEYTFYYDIEGNVIDKEYDADWSDTERREAIVYTYRQDDGLYEDADGNVFANLYNLTARYKYAEFEHDTFYVKNADGASAQVSFDDLKDGETYYSNAACSKVASHYLCVDSQRVYAYDSDENAYYYMVNGERGVKVNNFDAKYARYVVRDLPEYSVKVEDTHNEWVTVNFIIATGEKERDYRLELWSGERGETGANGTATGAVAFDYSSYEITSSNYSDVLSQYENSIIEAYEKLILSKDAANAEKLESGMKIYELEALIDELGITQAEKEDALVEAGIDKDFVAEYYTFTLYDSAEYVPFNRTTAEEGQTGYEYTINDNPETLVYFRNYDANNKTYNMFADYSAVDKSYDLGSTDNDDSSSDTDDSSENNGDSPWLLIASIIFAVVMIFTLIAMFVRYLWKKFSVKRGNKKLQKNNYKQRNRYIRKHGIITTETEPQENAEENGDGDNLSAEENNEAESAENEVDAEENGDPNPEVETNNAAETETAEPETTEPTDATTETTEPEAAGDTDNSDNSPEQTDSSSPDNKNE